MAGTAEMVAAEMGVEATLMAEGAAVVAGVDTTAAPGEVGMVAVAVAAIMVAAGTDMVTTTTMAMAAAMDTATAVTETDTHLVRRSSKR